jgi:dihydroflavonol-4-reductase
VSEIGNVPRTGGQTGVRHLSDPRRVAVTGATGFLGSHIADALRGAGWLVTAIVRPGNTKPVPAGVDAIESPLEPAALTSVLAGTAVIVHAAGLTRAADDRAFHAVNVGGTEAVVAAANNVGAHLILISSQAAIGTGTRQRPSLETDPPHPINAYGRSKLAAEDVVRARSAAGYTILRPCAVYGPGDRQFLPLFRWAARGLFLAATPPATAFTFVYVDDAVNAVLLAIDRVSEPRPDAASASRTVFIGHPQSQTADDLLRHIAAAVGRRYRPVRIPGALISAAAWFGELWWRIGGRPALDRSRAVELQAEGFVCSVDRARDELGFSATVGLSDGLARTARWYRERGWL